MLLSYHGILLVLYSSAVVQAKVFDVVRTDVRGEVLAAVLTGVGLALCLRSPLRGARYVASVVCLATAPIAAVLFHDHLVAQVWSVVPLIFVAIFLRTWHEPTTARTANAVMTLGAVAALVVAPAPVPLLYLIFYAASVIGACEVFGLANAALLEAAFRDPLTAVWNRAGIKRQVHRLVTQARRRRQQIAVLVFDVDDFKEVNDQSGHAAGDLVLSELARRWRALAPRSSVVGRIGGDEFVIVVSGYAEQEAQSLAATLAEGHLVRVTYGVAVGPADQDDFDGILAAADADLYQRKRSRRA
ncbi:GGDEF domain-containing protein [Mycolicibacterium vaccae]|uniref:GGDEF domain-containing protein n=1 Tax=Mycolicibacterium vaccae TaxID=1810 RepID=UPI003CE80FD5